MKHFEWVITQQIVTDKKTFSILEKLEEGEYRFWGVLHEKDGLYQPYIFRKDRKGYITIEEFIPFAEAKLAAEKRLFDDGIIQNGDELVDYTTGKT